MHVQIYAIILTSVKKFLGSGYMNVKELVLHN